MYTIGEIARNAGFTLLAATNGFRVEVVDASIDPPPSFVALVSDSRSIDPSMPLGMDLREAGVIETLRELLPASILARGTPAKIKAKIRDTYVLITKREDSVSSPYVKFDVVKLL